LKNKKLTATSKDSYTEMILRLAIAAEYKDDEIGAHIIRVSDYSMAIAAKMDLSVQDIENIRFASIMHDIGKIGISDIILHRKKLTPKIFNKIKEHTVIGSRIFAGSDSPLLKAASDVALYHHERYDGKGYPIGLKAGQIPLYARIVALADNFDAIISERSYKKSSSFNKTVEMIKKQKGKYFDPEVVDAFIQALPSIREIFKANKTIKDFLKESKRLLKKAKF
jgi:putative two-component system response regulator